MILLCYDELAQNGAWTAVKFVYMGKKIIVGTSRLTDIFFPRLGWVPLATFDIASETTQLIYGQTITWLGLFFSPLLPVLFSVILIITFYIKQASSAKCLSQHNIEK